MVEEYGVITKAGKRKGSGGGRKPRVTNGLNKGLWTPEEDAILIKYVQENGERFWNNIWRSHGLMRCGKSCKRRWMNNLRSNLKKEEFTLEEENKILRLHAEHGNRWSLLALHFPGRTDKEIKNYWNVRHKRLTQAGLPIYPPEIQKEIDLRDIQLQQKEDIKNKLQISPSSTQNKTNHDLASITPLLSIEAANKYNDKSIATSSSNSLDENPDFSLIDPMKYPLMYASLYPPSKMLLGDSNGKATLAPPPPSIIIPSNNSPHITPIDQTPTTISENTLFPILEDTFISENFELEIPSIYSSFQTTAPMSDHVIVPPNGDDNQIMDPEFFLERNTGTLGDIVRESKALFSYNRKNQLKDDQHDGRIVHDHDTISIMHNTFNNVNVGTNFAPVGVDKTPMESTSSLQSSTGINELDMRVNPQACVLEDFYITGNDLRGWPEFQQQTVPIEPANVSNGTIAATRNNLNSEITPSDQIDDDWGAVALSLIETIPADTDHDWTDQ